MGVNLSLRRARQQTPGEAATVIAAVMKKLDAELTAALDLVPGWWRSDQRSGLSFVSAGRIDGSATIVGNSGGWWLVRSGPGDELLSERVCSARAALTQLAPATPSVVLTKAAP